MRWTALLLACLLLAGCASPLPAPERDPSPFPAPWHDPLLHANATACTVMDQSQDGLARQTRCAEPTLFDPGPLWNATRSSLLNHTRMVVWNDTVVLSVGDQTHSNGTLQWTDGNGTFRVLMAPSPDDAPQVSFLVDPVQPVTGHSIRFVAQPVGDARFVSYEWRFGWPGEPAFGEEVRHVFRSAGQHVVSLTARTEDNRTALASTTLDVLAEQELLTFTVAPATLFLTGGARVLRVPVGEPLQFEALPNAGFSTATFAWSFGDGATATGITASHSYAAEGDHAVDLTATRPDGTSFAIQKRLQVRNEMPFADFWPQPAPEPGFVVLNASAWDLDGRIVSYRWDVDNRTVSFEPRLVLEAGRHWVTLTVTDDDGATASRSGAVEA